MKAYFKFVAVMVAERATPSKKPPSLLEISGEIKIQWSFY